MTKISKSFAYTLIPVLTLSVFVLASVFTSRSTVTARASVAEPMASVKPVRGIDVVVIKDHPMRQTQTDAEGSFIVGDLLPGKYEVSLVCKAKCQGMNDLSAGVLQFTLTATSTSSRLREPVFSQQEADTRKLIAGVTFSIEIAGKKGEPKTLNGIVSLLK